MTKQLSLNLDGQLSLDIPTALGPGDPDDGDEGRKARGMAIAAITSIDKTPLGYRVPSQSGNGSYMVSVGETVFCSCADFEKRRRFCKHVVAVEYIIRREERPDGTTIETKAMRVTAQGQSWAEYNAAQVNEQEHFVTLLRELADTIRQEPQQGRGRPRLPLSDMVFGIGVKVYSTMSGRRAMTDIRNAHRDGLMDKAPSFASVARYLENPSLTPVLKSLIERSALPLKAVETDFAADGTGFSSSVYHRWFDHKWGREIKEAQWVKAHVMCGVQTNIVTAAEVSEGTAHDSPYFPTLVETTARGFTVSEVSADKAYLSKRNLAAVDQVGGEALIPFKSNSVVKNSAQPRDGLWERAFHYFHLNRAEFLARYHKRSNVETAFSMVKAKFGGAVRSKTPVAQANEVLVKILCHNIVVLVAAMYELGLNPVFATEGRGVAKFTRF